MHTYEEIKEMLCKELEQITKKGELTAGSLETVDKILNSIKNAHKIIMYEEYEDGDYSRNDGMSMEGGYSTRRRDAMGRYTRKGDYVDRGGRAYKGYSYDAGKEEKIEALREVMNDANSEEEKRIIHKIIRRMEIE